MLKRFTTVVLRSIMAATLISVHAVATAAEPRLALIITNANYPTEIGRLENPHGDGAKIADALQSVGFAKEDIAILKDVDQVAFKQALVDYIERIEKAGADSIVFFYYSGHGAADRTDRGENYLLPVGIKITRSNQLPIVGIALSEIAKALEGVPAKARFVIIDACRNVAFTAGSKNATKGFLPQRKLDGTILAFSTRPGETADDSDAFSSALAAILPTPGLRAEEVFKETQLRVAERTNGRQIPWTEDGLLTRFWFRPSVLSSRPPVGALKFTDVAAQTSASENASSLSKQPAPPSPSPAPPVSDTDRARQLNATGVKQMMGQCRQAIALFNKALELEPKLSDPYFNIGFCKEYLGDDEGAIASYLKAIEIGPGTSNWSRKQLAAIYDKRRAFDKAGDAYSAWMKYDRNNIEPVIGLCIAAVQAKNAALATTHCGHLVERWPKERDSHAARAQAFELVGDLQAAAKSYLDAASLGGLGEDYFAAAQLQAKSGNLTEARKNFEQSASKAYKATESYTILGEIAARTGDLDAAIKHFGLAVQRGPSADIYVKRGRVYERLADLTKARADYERAVVLDRGHAAANAALRRLPQ